MATSDESWYTPIDDIEKVHAKLTATFKSGVTRPLEYRRAQLLQLARMCQENEGAIARVLNEDLGRPKIVSNMAESGACIAQIMTALRDLEEWAKPQELKVEEWRASWQSEYYYEPMGAILIIAPWNYPFALSLHPLVGAIAAGCTVLIKPSEVSAASGKLLAELIPKYLDPNAFAVVTGAVAETTRVLELRWDHILYTGNGRIARIVAAAAAKHLTPLTLELGGKSPAIIAEDADLDLAAKRILNGKIQNTGQLCVSPDYVLVPNSKKDEFLGLLKKYYDQFFPDGALQSPDWGKIINPTHHKRLTNLLKNTQGKIFLGGQTEGDRKLEPTVVSDVQPNDVLMEEEIFGPILPVLTYDTLDQALAVISGIPSPLAIYVFTSDEHLPHKIRAQTRSGQFVVNETFIQIAVYELPFGGLGESGYGRWQGKHSFVAFSHQRLYLHVPVQAEPFLGLRYPPYTQEALDFFSHTLRQPLPKN